MKESSSTTKLRVVFDGSQKTDTVLALNDVQFPGPSLQANIFAILLKFRKHRYIVTADIEKMFRQILIDSSDRKYQRIFWREQQSEELKLYELNTVTYGTASAPFLAVRCLQLLAEENTLCYPIEAQIIKQDIYVDDLITGRDNIDELNVICDNIYKIFKNAGFNLRKWNSNSTLMGTKNIQFETSSLEINDKEFKTLGINYDSTLDVFKYAPFKTIKLTNIITKRHILKNMSRIFDPLGLLSPCTIIPKLIIQRTWRENLDWDQPVPHSIKADWIHFIDGLKTIDSLHIPRHIFLPNALGYRLHGFSDASEAAYGACIYVQSRLPGNSSSCYLLTAKSRVAPIKNVTLPRLELCAATLLAQLVNRVVEIFDIEFERISFWSDFQITLAWIKDCPSRWKTFVANRVAELLIELTNKEEWFYIKSRDNPADFITKGISLTDSKDRSKWWSGPDSEVINNHDVVPFKQLEDIPE